MAQLQLTILDPIGVRKTLVEVPDDVATQRMIKALVNRMGLPPIDAHGQPISYRLLFSQNGSDVQLQPEQTFAEAGIRNNDLLRLQTEMIGGAATPASGSDFDLADIKIHGAEVVDQPVQGPPYARPTEIIVEARAWEQMNQHAGEDLRHEAGGIMLGEIFAYEETTVVRITTAVAAREAINSMTSIQFTYNAWSQMEKERRQSAPTEKLVGWYHTHPGFSAFFSDTDRFMHEHFFTQPWHVALVIDPVNGEQRFYRWEEGRVRETTEFLLQVASWPGPQPPVGAVLSTALRQAARQVEKSPDGADAALAPALHKLVASLRRRPAAGSLGDLLPFIVACSEVEPEALAAARRRMLEEAPAASPLRLADLEVAHENLNPEGAVTIAAGWLAQQVDRHYVHLHGLEESQAFCGDVVLPVPVRDLAIDERGHLVVLAASRERPLHRLEPALAQLRGAARATERRQRLVPLEVDWKGDPPDGIGKILAVRRDLYLLTRAALYLLVADARDPDRRECAAVHPAAACGWDSFENLISWAGDAMGNLFLLRAGAQDIWRYDRLAASWSSFVADPQLGKPLDLAAGTTALSVYDGGASPAIVQYGIADGRLLCRRPLDPEILRSGFCHLLSDGYQRLYIVTDRRIYQTF
jgi:proteasome lid subunit RPN8/RPN11